MANCLIINARGEPVRALVRELAAAGYFVYVSIPKSDVGGLESLSLTNPEFDSQYVVIQFEDNESALQSITAYLQGQYLPLDNVVSLNNSHSHSLDTRDLDLISKLDHAGIVGANTNIVVGTTPHSDIASETQKDLQRQLAGLEATLKVHSISEQYGDVVKVDEELDCLTTNVVPYLRRANLKVKTVTSAFDIVKLVLYYVLPDALLSLLQ